jgi:hypothetical protein
MAAFDARACNTHDAVAGIDAQGGGIRSLAAPD